MDEDRRDDLPAPPSMLTPTPGAGGFGTVESRPAPTTSGSDTGAILSLIGGTLAVIGVFLPWVSSTNGVITDSHNGIDIGTYGTLLLGGLAAARAFGSIRAQQTPLAIRGSSMITGGLILGLIALRWSTLQNYLTDARSLPGVTASIGPGVWLVIAGGALVFAGGALVFAGGALTWTRRRSAP